MKQVSCSFCKNDLMRRNNKINKYNTYFCNNQCKSNHYKTLRKNNTLCEFCNVYFYKKLGAKNRTKHNFCSKNCSLKYFNSRRTKKIKEPKFHGRLNRISKSPLDIFKLIVEESTNYRQILKAYGYNPGSSYNTVKKMVGEENIDTSHFKTSTSKKISISEKLTNHTSLCTVTLKNHLISNGSLQNKCQICDLEEIWNNKPIILHLDHIDGNRTNNTIKNCRLLCPNCHSQTPTFGCTNPINLKVFDMELENFKKIIQDSNSFANIYRNLNLPETSIRFIQIRIIVEKININHFSDKAKKLSNLNEDIDDLLIDSTKKYNTFFKWKLIYQKYLDYQCDLCSLNKTWQNEILFLQLDHIDGNCKNNKLSNLRLLCPNCHSQTSTYTGKNSKKVKKDPKKLCSGCKQNEIYKESSFCRKCSSISSRKVKNRPTKEQLLIDTKNLGFVKTGEKYGVSDNCIRKWINSNH